MSNISRLFKVVSNGSSYDITEPMPWTRKIKWSMTVFSPSLISKPSTPRLTISGRICPSCEQEQHSKKHTRLSVKSIREMQETNS